MKEEERMSGIEPIAEGKTKRVWEFQGDPKDVILESKNDITAGDGAKHDVIVGKGGFSNRTTSAVFRLLQRCGYPVAFIEQLDETQLRAKRATMILLEVVARREVHGSYRERNPHLPLGHYLPRLMVEFFAKTRDKLWNDRQIPIDDPLVDLSGDDALFFMPGWTKDQKEESKKTGHQGYLVGQRPFLSVPKDEFLAHANCPREHLLEIKRLTRQVFLVLEKAWQLLGYTLVDFKLEFGWDVDGNLVVADVIDNDSWRLLDEAREYMDKQVYRDGGNLEKVTRNYRLIAELASRFAVPRQRMILWRGSDKDDVREFEKALHEYGATNICDLTVVTRSMHKQPVMGVDEIARLIQEVPDSVIIAYIGRSNGAGPTLSTQVSVPVISVPASWKECPEDVWSSLRTPSETPTMTVLEPKNAVLAALQMLAMRNPQIYAELRIRQEERLSNFVMI